MAKTITADPAAVAAYLAGAPEGARPLLLALAAAIREEAPAAVERMAYGLATWREGENLIHLGAFAKHVGIYPGAEAVAAFAAELTAWKTSKGAIQVPLDEAPPIALVRRLVRFRRSAVAAKAAARAQRPA